MWSMIQMSLQMQGSRGFTWYSIQPPPMAPLECHQEEPSSYKTWTAVPFSDSGATLSSTRTI